MSEVTKSTAKSKPSGLERLEAKYTKQKAKLASKETKQTEVRAKVKAGKTGRSEYKKKISEWKSSKPTRPGAKEKKPKVSPGLEIAKPSKGEARHGKLAAKAQSKAWGARDAGKTKKQERFQKKAEKHYAKAPMSRPQ